ncbi:MAG: Holliday junction resolvase RuvX [Candidatus Shikimatogenerans bostrichidophilus]|nr:MAG: Holliday junction resolvase RuvX [Candidatus Shikimatogenerans bostrichidophilus]
MIKNKLLGIDYGKKRCGISITDNFKKLAIGLICINTNNLINFLKVIIVKENINIIVLGLPKKKNNKDQFITKEIRSLKNKILNIFPKLIIDFVDERYTSNISKYYLNEIKFPKNKIKEETNIMSAILILQSYLKINNL